MSGPSKDRKPFMRLLRDICEAYGKEFSQTEPGLREPSDVD